MESYRKIIKLVNKMGDDREANLILIKKNISVFGIEDIKIIFEKCNDIKKIMEFLISSCYGDFLATQYSTLEDFISVIYEQMKLRKENIDIEFIDKLSELAGFKSLYKYDFLEFERIKELILDMKTKEYATKSFNNLKKEKYLCDMEFLDEELEDKNENEIKEHIIEIFGDINYIDEEGSLLHHVIDSPRLSDERLIFACLPLLKIGVDPNLVYKDNYTFLDNYLKHSKIDKDVLFELLKISIEYGFNGTNLSFLQMALNHEHNYELYKLIVDNGCQITDSFNFKEVDGWCCEDAKKISISAHFRLMLSNIKVIFNKYSFEENFDKKLFYIEEELFAIFEEMLEMDDSWYDIQSLIVGNILKNKESEIVLNKMISANEVIDAIYEIYKNKLNEKKRETQVKILEYTSNQVGGYNGKL